MEESKVPMSIIHEGDAYEGDHHCDLWSGHDQKGIPIGYRTCKTHPGHKDFMTIDEFKEKCSSLYSNECQVAKVWDVINKTVRVQVSHTSVHRPDTYNRSNVPYPLNQYRGRPCMRLGSGYLYGKLNPDEANRYMDADKPCPCFDCRNGSKFQESKPPISHYFVICTATHVIYDESEAVTAVCEFHYDTDDRKGVKCVYGVGVRYSQETRLNTDFCRVVCVTHDQQLAEELSRLCDSKLFRIKFDGPHFLVSHPHGVSKKISFGKVTRARQYAFQEGNSPITLKKGLKVCITGDQDKTEVIKMLNLVENDKIDDDDDNSNVTSKIHGLKSERDGGRKTFKLASDVIVRSPLGLTLHTDIDPKIWRISRIPLSDVNKWWTIPTDAQFVTDRGGTPFTLPYSPDLNDVKFELRVKNLFQGASLIRSHTDDNRLQRFDMRFSYNYTMAACPGSSGSLLYRGHRWKCESGLPGFIHFGITGNYCRTSLGKFLS